MPFKPFSFPLFPVYELAYAWLCVPPNVNACPCSVTAAPLQSNIVGREPINICWPDKGLAEKQKSSRLRYYPGEEWSGWVKSWAFSQLALITASTKSGSSCLWLHLGGKGKRNEEFKASFGYGVSLRAAWTKWGLVCKGQKPNKQLPLYPQCASSMDKRPRGVLFPGLSWPLFRQLVPHSLGS